MAFLEAIAGQVGAAIGRAELFSRVNALAYADPLTGLGNRRALDDQLDAAVVRGAPLTIAFCDLDGLKQINDGEGHDAGDEAIRRAGDALVVVAGEGDEPTWSPSPGRRLRRDRTSAENRALADRLLDTIVDLPAIERAESLAAALADID